MESPPKPKEPVEMNLSPERQKLKEFEETELYVFHGTKADVEELEPRQAIDNVTGPDDEPGVHASQIADYAIFMAVAAPLGHSRSGATDSEDGSITMHYGIEKAIQEQLNDQTSGWVYLFKRDDFKQRRSVEWISTKTIKPLFKIKVFKGDLPKDIETF